MMQDTFVPFMRNSCREKKSCNFFLDFLKLMQYHFYRTLALNLCDWGLNEEQLVKRLQAIASNGELERAAAMALFHNKLKLTINILSGANSKFYTSGN